MDIARVYHGGGAVLAAFAPDHDALRKCFFGRQHFKAVFFANKLRNSWLLTVPCLSAPFLWRKRDVAAGLSYLRFVCPPSRAVLTVADRFALDVVKVIDVSNQRYRTEDGKHNCGNGD